MSRLQMLLASAVLISLLALMLPVSVVNADEVVTEAWVAFADGLGDSLDITEAMAIDASGNVYVTGWSRTSELADYTTVKYSSAGIVLWVSSYHGPGSPLCNPDGAYDIAVDDSGNAYVTGSSAGSVCGNVDYATVKYDTNGNELWVNRYSGTGHDSANAIAVDSSGTVTVTGQSTGNLTGYDYATIKYDRYGNQLWVNRYDGIGHSNDIATNIAVDGSGNIYITGLSMGNGTLGWGYVTIKYDTNGNLVWVNRYDDPVFDNDLLGDRSNSIAVDSSGNVYVTGADKGIGTGLDYVTIKYDTNGNQLWVNRYDGPASGDDKATAIAVDSSRHCYVTGYSVTESGDLDYTTIEYNNDEYGSQAWVSHYDSPASGDDKADDIAIDSSRNVYVTGRSFGVGSTTIKYDTSGNQLWVFSHSGVRYDPNSISIAVDSSENVYVTGSGYGSIGTGWDYMAIKYTQTGVPTPTPTPTPAPVPTVTGTFTVSGGTVSGTYNTSPPYQVLTGSGTADSSFSGDIIGTSTFTGTYDATDQTMHSTTNPAPCNLTIGGVPHAAMIYGKGTTSNFVIGPPGYPNPSQVTFDFAASGDIWTTDGSNIFVHATGTGSGSATESWPAPGQYQMTDFTVSGTWSGTAQNFESAPQTSDVTPGSGTVTLSGAGGDIAQLNYTTTGSGTILVAQYEGNPGGTPVMTPLGKYVEVDTSIISPEITWPVQLRVYYTDAEVAAAGVDENSLRMYRWNGSSWELVADSGVNTTDNYVWANLYSFSPYGPMGGPLGGGGAVPVFPSIYIGIAAALGAGIVAYFVRRRLVKQG